MKNSSASLDLQNIFDNKYFNNLGERYLIQNGPFMYLFFVFLLKYLRNAFYILLTEIF